MKLDEEISGGKFSTMVVKMGKVGSGIAGAESGCREPAEERRRLLQNGCEKHRDYKGYWTTSCSPR